MLLLLAIAAAAVAIIAVQRRRWNAGAAMSVLALAGTALAVLEVGGALAPPPSPAPPAPAHGVRGQVLSGLVAHVRDGDTIVVGQTPIRFTDVDCPENGTPEGERATQALRRMVAGQQVECRLEGRRSYDREIGICSLAGRNLGLALVAQGLCLRR